MINLRNMIKDKATEVFTNTATEAVKNQFFTNIMDNDLVAVEKTLKKYKNIGSWRYNLQDYPPLFYAHFHGHADMMKLLMKYGMPIDEQHEGENLLHRTMSHSHCFETTIEAWQAQNLDINVRDADGNTLLILIARQGKPEQLAYLIDRGADIHAVNDQGEGAFMAATMAGNKDNLSALAEHGANINQPNKAGLSPLMKALNEKMNDTALHLLSLGVNTQGNAGGYALLTAVIAAEGKEDTDIIRKLIAHGISVNSTTTTEHGRMSALMYAAKKLSQPVLQCLLEAGADSGLTDASGMTALDHYKKNAPRNIGDILAEKMEEQMPSVLARHKKAIHTAAQTGTVEKVVLMPRIKIK